MNNEQLIELKNKATELRINAVRMIYEAQSGHPGGALSVADFVTACYFRFMNVRPSEPDWADRDRFVLSKGHACPAQYAALAMKGFVPMETIHTLRKEGSPFQGHPSMTKCPGIDISTGSLGQGLACAVGMALAGRMDGKDYSVYCAIGDGESQEGEIWEAANTAHKYKLDNLIIFIDFNNLQIDGTCDEVMPNLDLGKKFEAFGWDVAEIDGNDMDALVDTIEKFKADRNGRPKAIYAHTVKGKGVSYMENSCMWHGVAPNDEEFAQALKELNALFI